MKNLALFPFHHRVTFGDCDPAGIVFYPNIFRWMDAAFHGHLRILGGHAEICRRLGAVGLGLVDASARFKTPLRDGDHLVLQPRVTEWRRKTLTIAHHGCVGDRLAFEGREVRALFMQADDGLHAGELAPVRQLFESRPDDQ